MNILNAKNLTMSFGLELLYEGLDFGIEDGEKIALVGPNGCGKSTLFELLVDRLEPDEGQIAMRRDTRIGYLRQETSFAPGQTPRAVTSEAMEPVRRAIADYEEVSEEIGEAGEDPGRLDELVERQQALAQEIERLGGWRWEHRVASMVERLGMTDWLDAPMASLSGGQRRRVALARVLLSAPDLLLLDEPTNHLDPETVEWLEGWLHRIPGSVVFVTHDRYFLERVADRIFEIDARSLYDHPGDYQLFMERRLQRMEVRTRTEERRMKLISEELDWLERGMRDRASRTDKRVRQLERERAEGPRYDDDQLEVELVADSQLGDQILSARGVYKSFDDQTVLRHAHLIIARDDKIGVLGPNGSGKTTLLRLLTGELRPDAGIVERGPQTEIASMPQHGAELDEDQTVYEAPGQSDYVWLGDRRFHKREYLRRFLFDAEDQKRKIAVLSGGERRRLSLALLVARNANVLLLDEPTNDLDIDSLQALEEALASFEGCLVVVSHDRYFLERVCNTIVATEPHPDGGHRLRRYDGSYEYYRKCREAEREEQRRRDSAGRQAPESPREESPDAGSGERRGLSWKEERELEALEEEIEELEARRGEVEGELGDPSLYEERADQIGALNRELHRVSEELEALWERWAALEERREE